MTATAPSPDPPETLPVWHDTPPLDLPPLTGPRTADVCVIGLGGSGLSAIHLLREAGRSVIGVDAGAVGGGAAGRNGGFLLAGLASFYHQLTARHGRRATLLYRATLNELERIAVETPGLVRRPGSLRIALSAEELADCRRQLAVMRSDGLPVRAYRGPEGEGLLFPRDGVFQPLARCRLLAVRAVQAGAELYERSPAVAIEPGRVRTPEGEVWCGAVLAAVDGGLERLFPELGGRVRSARLQMLATAPAPEVHFPRPVYARYGLEYWQQLPDRRIALGGFRDAGGEAEWTQDACPTAPVQAALERFLRERLGVRAPVTHRWAGLVSYSSDGLPVIEEVRPGIWAVGGYSGTGNVVGALAGRAAAAAILGDRSTADLLRG